ncbi:MAG: hypothetical protein H7X94_03700 [Vallitaleaceae bacterium]|nr:hypothetical protein [Vallitaleaceae bacterium]
MGNAIGKLFSVLLAVLLLFIVPLMNMFEQQDQTTRIFVLTETTKFVDAVRNTGHIKPQMYEEFYAKLSATQNRYKITLEHRHIKFDPIYSDPMDPSTFEEDYAVNESAYYTQDIMAVLFPDLGLGNTYSLSSGDSFLVSVENSTKTFGTKVRQLFFGGNLPTQSIFVKYGGMIK